MKRLILSLLFLLTCVCVYAGQPGHAIFSALPVLAQADAAQRVVLTKAGDGGKEAVIAVTEDGKTETLIAKDEDGAEQEINVEEIIDAKKASSEPGFWDKFKESLYDDFVSKDRWKYLVNGFKITLIISAGATLIGILLGFLVAVTRITADRANSLSVFSPLRWLNILCKIYLTVIRGTPTVVQLMIIYFVIFGSVDIDKVIVATIAFGINSGAYVAEIVRSGIASIDKGQFEAASSLGLRYTQTMTQIILPQAFKNILPALGNEFIVLLKETSVSGYIALADLTKGGDIIRSQTYDSFLPLFAVAAIYLAVVMLFTWLLGKLERSLKKNE